MKKILLSTAVMLGIAASIFGGYYFYVTNDMHQTEVRESEPTEENITTEATDREIPFRQRGGALMDEHGDIDENGVKNALAQRDLYLAQHRPQYGFGDGGDAASIPAPPYIPDNWQPRGPLNMGGRTEAMLLHPNFGTALPNHSTMWAGGASGGVWISYNGGKEWSAVNGVLQNFNVSCFALDPEDTSDEGRPMTIYAGTGALDYHGGGVFRSIDGGMNWERVPRTDKWRNVTGLAVAHDNNGDTILLAAMEGSDIASSPDRGIMRYNVRLNTSWDMVIPASYGTSVGFDPNQPSKAVAAVCYRGNLADADGKCKAFYSDDYGATWSDSRLGNTATPNSSPTPGLFETAKVEHPIYFFFRSLPSGATTIYAQNGTGSGNTSVMSKSADGGINFSTYNMVGVPEGINEGVHPLWVSPEINSAGSNLVITGGAHLYRSTNNAQSFEPNKIANGYVVDNPVNPHGDMQFVVADPRGGTNKSAFVGTDGGVYRANDITAVGGLLVGAGTPTPFQTKNWQHGEIFPSRSPRLDCRFDELERNYNREQFLRFIWQRFELDFLVALPIHRPRVRQLYRFAVFACALVSPTDRPLHLRRPDRL